MIYQNKPSRFNLWKLAMVLPVTATLLMLFSFENTSNLSVFSEGRDNTLSTVTKNEFDRPYALRFGNIDFTLDKQKGDGKYWNPPTFVITSKTARRIAQYQPVLINRNNNITYNFQTDLWLGAMTVKPKAITPNADISKILSELDENKHTYISLKNIKLTTDATLLNLSLEIVPEDGVLLKWGNRQFPFDTQLKMSGNEFIEKITTHPLFANDKLVDDKRMVFQSIHKINTKGSQSNIDIHFLPISPRNNLTDIKEAMLLSTKAGDQFIFKGIYLESPNIPSEYSFSVEIISDSNPEISKELVPASEQPIIRYLLNGKPSDKNTIENLDTNEIIELKRFDKFGKPVEDKKKAELIIVKTK